MLKKDITGKHKSCVCRIFKPLKSIGKSNLTILIKIKINNKNNCDDNNNHDIINDDINNNDDKNNNNILMKISYSFIVPLKHLFPNNVKGMINQKQFFGMIHKEYF